MDHRNRIWWLNWVFVPFVLKLKFVFFYELGFCWIDQMDDLGDFFCSGGLNAWESYVIRKWFSMNWGVRGVGDHKSFVFGEWNRRRLVCLIWGWNFVAAFWGACLFCSRAANKYWVSLWWFINLFVLWVWPFLDGWRFFFTATLFC